MHTATILVGLGAFLACAVEMVEALTIVLGVGTVRGWRSTLIGVGAAAVVLAVLIAALGPALQEIPIDDLRLLVGGLLLVFGLQWLRKAILRSSGYKPLHDEDEAFKRERAEAEAAGGERRAGLDWYSFTVAFKGVLLEGLEVVFIVITFGSAQGRLDCRDRRRGRGTRGRRGGGRARARPAPAGSREHDQVRGRAATDELRLLLGRRGRGRGLARRRALAAGADRLLRRVLLAAGAGAAAPAPRTSRPRRRAHEVREGLRAASGGTSSSATTGPWPRVSRSPSPACGS